MSNSTTVTQFANAPWEVYLASTFIGATAIGGLLSNFVALFLGFRLRSSRQSFFELILSLIIADSSVLLVFLLWVLPLTATQNVDLAYDDASEAVSGTLIVAALMGYFNTGWLMSFSRLVAVAKPDAFGDWFTLKRTRLWICIVWLAAAITALPLLSGTCRFYFDPLLFLWMDSDFVSPLSCQHYLRYVHMTIQMLTVLSSAAMNLATVLIMRRQKRQVQASGAVNAVSAAAKRRDREFLRSSCAVCSVFVIGLFGFYVMPMLSTDRWFLFFLTTVGWETAHLVNANLLLALNAVFREELRKLFGKDTKKPKNPTVSGRSQQPTARRLVQPL